MPLSAVFISYRREDSQQAAGRLSSDLKARFGPERVFIDVTGVELGRDFRKSIDTNLATCGVVLAVIGPGWLNARDGSGRRRLDDPKDFVRVELANALKRDIPVIPIRVDGAAVPNAEQLPDDLVNLSFRNAFELTHSQWEPSVRELVERLVPLVGRPRRIERKFPLGLTILVSVSALLLAVGGVSVYRREKALQTATAERVAADKLAADKLAADKLAPDKLAAAKLAADKPAADKPAADKPADKPAANSAAAEQSCEVVISSDPLNADVIVDGVSHGETEAHLQLVRGKTYALRVEKADYKPYGQQIDCSRPRVYATLQQKLGAITVRYGGNPPGISNCTHDITIDVGDKSLSLSGNSTTASGVRLGHQDWRVNGSLDCYYGSCTVDESGSIDLTDHGTYKLRLAAPSTARNELGQCGASLQEY